MTYSKIQNILPGLGLSVAVAIAAIGIERVEEHYAGRAWLEALVIAILLGTLVRTFLRPGPQFNKGIGFRPSCFWRSPW